MGLFDFNSGDALNDALKFAAFMTAMEEIENEENDEYLDDFSLYEDDEMFLDDFSSFDDDIFSDDEII